MRSRTRSLVYSAATVLIALVVLEIGASWLMLIHYRTAGAPELAEDTSYLSLVNLARRVGRSAGWSEPLVTREETSPSPFFRPDPLLGYSAAPGVYTHTFARRNVVSGEWEHLRNRVTIAADGSRFAGAARPGRPTVYIFGDSWVFGTGVPDELTFASRLHEALPDWNVKLFALGGWSLTQAWLNVDRLASAIGRDDVVILGYAGYYDVRHVVAPSRLREIATWLERIGQPIPPFRLPRAALAPDGKLAFSYIEQRCDALGDYCRQLDPSPGAMADVSAALVNGIANRLPAKVYLLPFAGASDNPVFTRLDPKVTLIRALRRDFDSVVQDDIMGFDGHPGPFWHYAISRRILDAVSWQRP